MGSSLVEYLRMKVHPDVQRTDWCKVVVIGDHQRDSDHVRISSIEKADKPFNWQRPTVSRLNAETLQLHCFPGLDYVRHYAAIVATYLHLERGKQDLVQYRVPSFHECLLPLLNSNLPDMGTVDTVVVGYVHGLTRWTNGPWEGHGTNKLFSWRKVVTKHGRRVAFLGCRVSFWGDIAGNLVRALTRLNQAQCILYVGKLGSLRAEHVPNQWLATGCQSVVNGELVTWTNPLEQQLQGCRRLARGVHCTLGSVLDETKTWLQAVEARYDFVDPEIGHMAQAANDCGVDFGYLHVISDNLARKYRHDLSNERLFDVLEGRKQRVVEIQDILQQFFDE